MSTARGRSARLTERAIPLSAVASSARLPGSHPGKARRTRADSFARLECLRGVTAQPIRASATAQAEPAAVPGRDPDLRDVAEAAVAPPDPVPAGRRVEAGITVVDRAVVLPVG